jgi:hypothetical protein
MSDRPAWFGPFPEGACPAWEWAHGAIFECRLPAGHNGRHSDPIWARHNLAPKSTEWEPAPDLLRRISIAWGDADLPQPQ